MAITAKLDDIEHLILFILTVVESDEFLLVFDLRLTNNLGLLLVEILLYAPFKLRHDRSIRLKHDSLVAFKSDKDMLIRHEEHLVNFVDLLEAHDVCLATSR